MHITSDLETVELPAREAIETSKYPGEMTAASVAWRRMRSHSDFLEELRRCKSCMARFSKQDSKVLLI